MSFTKEELELLFYSMDTDKSGEVSTRELMDLLCKVWAGDKSRAAQTAKVNNYAVVYELG